MSRNVDHVSMGGAGVVDCQAGTGSVELGRYPNDHPFAQLQGSDNIIAFTTQRYRNQPLIVRWLPSAQSSNVRHFAA
jgi:hypothetical protein